MEFLPGRVQGVETAGDRVHCETAKVGQASLSKIDLRDRRFLETVLRIRLYSDDPASLDIQDEQMSADRIDGYPLGILDAETPGSNLLDSLRINAAVLSGPDLVQLAVRGPEDQQPIGGFIEGHVDRICHTDRDLDGSDPICRRIHEFDCGSVARRCSRGA